MKYTLKKNSALVWGGVLLGAAVLACSHASRQPHVVVFAALSTTNAMTDVGQLFTRQNGIQVTFSFAAASTLAKQIEQDAPAHIFLSANSQWMDYLAEKKKIDPQTRFDLLSNQVVLIAPKDSEQKLTIAPGFDLVSLLGNGKLVMGDPDHVPAGIYGKQALQSLGVWEKVEPKVARAQDVRGALVLVEQKEAPLGIVYATDAAISHKVKILGAFPEQSHPAIAYPVALVAGKSTPEAVSFMAFLKTPQATAIFKKYGFLGAVNK